MKYEELLGSQVHTIFQASVKVEYITKLPSVYWLQLPEFESCRCLFTEELNLPADIPSYLSSQGTLSEPQEGYSNSEAGSHQQLMPPANGYIHKGTEGRHFAVYSYNFSMFYWVYCSVYTFPLSLKQYFRIKHSVHLTLCKMEWKIVYKVLTREGHLTERNTLPLNRDEGQNWGSWSLLWPEEKV